MKHILLFEKSTKDFTAWCKPKSSGAKKSTYIRLRSGDYCTVDFEDDAKEMVFLMQWSENRVITDEPDHTWERLLAIKSLRDKGRVADKVLFTKHYNRREGLDEELSAKYTIYSEVSMIFECLSEKVDEWRIMFPKELRILLEP